MLSLGPSPGFGTLAAQAQALSLVRGLEGTFLSDVASGIRSNPFVSDSGRDAVVRLLEREAPAREVGDALFRANAAGWLNRMQKTFGEGMIRGAWHDASCVLRPFEPRLRDKGDGGGDTGDVLEVHCEASVMASHDALSGGLGLIDWGLTSRGYFGLSVSARDFALKSEEYWITFRLLPPTVLETRLAEFLGLNASQFCMTARAASPRLISLLHQARWHPIWMPMAEVLVHCYDSEPIGVAVHDEGHAAYWAAAIPAPVRIGASLLYDALEEALPEPSLQAVESEASALLDLGFDIEMGGVNRVLQNLEGRLDRDLMKGVRRLYQLKWEEARRELGEDMDLVWSYPPAIAAE